MPSTFDPAVVPTSYASVHSAVSVAIAAGATIVTPNNRLARRLSTLDDAAQRASGRRVWATATVVPWNAWLGSLWRDAVAASVAVDAPRLLTPAQAAALWRRVVAAELSRSAPLVDAVGAAALAAEAWERLHAYGAGGESWRGWDAGTVGDDPAAFARWAESFQRALQAGEAIDLPQVADRLLRDRPAWQEFLPRAIALTGFVDLSPQQQRLVAAIAAAGVEVTRIDSLATATQLVEVAACTSPREEIVAALHWARRRAEANPQAVIGVVVLDLAARRDEIRALADDVLCPSLLWPGRAAARRPYNLSLGTALAEVPCIATALDLLDLCEGPIGADRAARLLRSRHLPGDDAAWLARAPNELRWRKDGRSEIDAGTMIRAVSGGDGECAQRWRAAVDAAGFAGRAAPRDWCESWRTLLAAAGWPGDGAKDSAEHQALGAWDDLLAAFATLDAVTDRLSRSEALAAVRTLASETLFQPESDPAPIEILGLLEAAGLPFDALWVAGMAADAWPPAARPNPLLPLAWQRERGVPRSSAARELGYADALTALLARAAPTVVFSHPQNADDHRCEASALLAVFPRVEPPAVDERVAQAMFDARPALVAISDGQAPTVPPGTAMKGGAALIEAQSDCPFRATAAYRLGAERWPRRDEGLSAMERGQLAHLALAAFWRAVRDHRTLIALSPEALAAAVDAAVGEALGASAVTARRWAALPRLLAPVERDRLCSLVHAWLERGERARPQFTVAEIEAPLGLEIEGISIRFRLDRVDILADGSVAIIDYKTGATVTPAKWFEPRPQAPQLGVYLLARRAALPAHDVGALAYARLAPDALGWAGIAATEELLPPLAAPSVATRGAVADWPAVEAFWRVAIGGLAAEIAAGVAVVRPRDTGTTCRRCGLQSLCRIDGVGTSGSEEVTDAR